MRFELVHPMEAAISGFELIPGLLNNFWVGVRLHALSNSRGSHVISQKHFGATQVVIEIYEVRPFFLARLDQFFALGSIALSTSIAPSFVSGKYVVRVELDSSGMPLSFRNFIHGTISVPKFLMQPGCV